MAALSDVKEPPSYQEAYHEARASNLYHEAGKMELTVSCHKLEHTQRRQGIPCAALS